MDDKRLECVWCAKHHPMDGRGPITQEDRQAGLVVTGLCDQAKQDVSDELDQLPQLNEELERESLLRYAHAEVGEDFDEAGIERRVLLNERVLVWVILSTIALLGIGFLLGRL